ncbi:MAG: hypothetical protein H6905_08610 [Hyphomicrobiales bacterium]|nr:hypothetical protein [Hyphomicrobiales bacterium]
MVQQYLQIHNSAGAANGDQRRASERRASRERRGTGSRTLDRMTQRPYGFRAFDDRRSEQDRRRDEGGKNGKAAAKPAPIPVPINDAMAAERFEPRPRSVKPAERSGQFRVLSVRRMERNTACPPSAAPSQRGRIFDWEG